MESRVYRRNNTIQSAQSSTHFQSDKVYTLQYIINEERRDRDRYRETCAQEYGVVWSRLVKRASGRSQDSKTVAGGGTSTVSGDKIFDTRKFRSVKTSAFNFFRTTYPLTPTPLSNSTEFALIP